MTKRIIGIVNIKDGVAVQSINFVNFLPIGDPAIIVDFLYRWGIDEIVMLDISRDINFDKRFFKKLKLYTKNIFVPIAVGGGIKDISHAHYLFRNGADKVIINTEFFNNPDLVKKISNKFGKQSVVISLDFKRVNKKFQIFSNNGRKIEKEKVEKFLDKAQNLGAGELIINSINRDGSKMGFDNSLINFVEKNTNLPFNIVGGAGREEDFAKAMSSQANGICAGNFFLFKEHSVLSTKKYLSSKFKEKIRDGWH